MNSFLFCSILIGFKKLFGTNHSFSYGKQKWAFWNIQSLYIFPTCKMKTEVKLISAVSSKRTLVQRKKSNQKFIKHLGTINKMQPKVYNKIVFKENTFRRSSKIERNILSKNNNNKKKKICGKGNLFVSTYCVCRIYILLLAFLALK